MIHTEKRYKKVGESYIEDPDGFIIGFTWTDDDGIDRRCLYIRSTDDLEAEYSDAVCRYEMRDPQNDEWVIRRNERSYAKMDSYVYADGTLEPDPFDSEGNLKPGLTPEFEFFFNAQLAIYHGVMKSIQIRKFGATGFN